VDARDRPGQSGLDKASEIINSSDTMMNSDPFLWLEEIDSPQALAWVRAQNAHSLLYAKIARNAHSALYALINRNRDSWP